MKNLIWLIRSKSIVIFFFDMRSIILLPLRRNIGII